MSKNLKLIKVSDLPEAKSIDNLLTLGVDSNNNSVKVPIELLKGNKGDTGESGGNLTSKSIYNITQTTGLTYSDKQTARNAVVSNLRASGQIIAYKLTTGWVNEQYIGADINGWGIEGNWNSIGAFSISSGKNIEGALVSGGYIQPFTGVKLTSADYHYTNFIKVRVGDVLRISGCFAYNSGINASNSGIAGYSSNTETSFVTSIFDLTKAETAAAGRRKIIDFDIVVPVGVNYIRGSSCFQNGGSLELPLSIVINPINVTIADFTSTLGKRVDSLESELFKNIDLTTDIEQGAISSGDGSNIINTTRIRTTNYYPTKFEVRNINTGYRYIMFQYTEAGLTSVTDWQTTPKKWNLTPSTKVRFAFSKTSGTNIAPAEFGDIGFELIVPTTEGGTTIGTTDVILRNKEAEKAALAIRKKFDTQNTTNETDIPFFAHTSDYHEDPVRLSNFIKYCEHLQIDAAFITGDIVSLKYDDDFSYYKTKALAANIKMYHVLGNHENENAISQTDTMQHARFFTDIDSKMNMVNEGKGYYYNDLTSKKIRIIALNEYQYGGTTRHARYLLPDQINWFINTLKSTPAGYGIFILMHQPCHSWNKNVNYSKFWQSQMFYTEIMTNITGSPIADIIDAFISKTSINKSYNQSGAVKSVDINANFSTGINSGVEFIAYANGHLHGDFVGYLNGTTHKQLVLNITCGNAFVSPWRDGLSDLPRKSGTVAEDAFNIYGIDRLNGIVKIVRIGSNINYLLEKRESMVIPYK